MATAISTNDLRSLQNRVQELELQVRELKALLGSPESLTNGVKKMDVANIGIDDEEFHKSTLEAQKYIEHYRKLDRRKVMAEYDRLHGARRKAKSPSQKAVKKQTGS